MKQFLILTIVALFTMGMVEAPIPAHKPARVAPVTVEKEERIELSETDLKLYRQVFELQEYTDWKKADELIKKLDNKHLMPYVLFQRYLHPTSYRSKYSELKEWLDYYPSYAGADEIYQLALVRKGKDAVAPKKPKSIRGIVAKTPDFEKPKKTYYSYKRRSNYTLKKVNALKAQVQKDLKCCGAATRALGRLQTKEAKKLLDTVEIDRLKGKIATTYFYLNRVEKAFNTASQAADRSGVKAPVSAWIAGLSAWRLKDFEKASHYFEIAASSSYVSVSTAAASAFWASRAYLRIRQPEKVNYWLSQAAIEPRTFYGLLARRSLGWNFKDLKWEVPKFEKFHEERIKQNHFGFRAYLLLQVGQRVLAEQELMKIDLKGSQRMEEALIAFASHHKLPALLYRMSTSIKDREGNYYNGALYPHGSWNKMSKTSVDEALIHAFIRQESRFDPHARSYIGASGLMQLLPSTATFVTGEKVNGKNRYKLLHPDRNVDIGARYIDWLLDLDIIQNDLFKMVISYNAGQGNMNRWFRQLNHENDPLFFIESIPVAETRHFVEKVMANFWLYRLSLGQETPSLTQVSRGDWPLYKSLDRQ